MLPASLIDFIIKIIKFCLNLNRVILLYVAKYSKQNIPDHVPKITKNKETKYINEIHQNCNLPDIMNHWYNHLCP